MADVSQVSANRRTIALFSLAALLSALLLIIALGKLKDAAIAVTIAGGRIAPMSLLHALGPIDAALALLTALAFVALAIHEVRGRGFSRLLATATHWQAFVLLTVLAAWFGQAYLGAGVLLGGDTATHVSRFMEIRRGLEAGNLPFWTNYQYTGAPLLWFTGPLSYVVGGVLAFLLHDAVLAAKLFLFTLHVASAWMFFALLRRLDIRPVAAMIAAAAFAGAFAHLQLFIYRGVYPQAITIVALVALFFAADGIMRQRGSRAANVVIFALATAGLIVNHQPHALFSAFYLAIFTAILLTLGFWRWPGIKWLVLAGVLGVVASAIAVVPTIAEADWVMLETDSGLFRFHLPALQRLGHLLVWRNSRSNWGIDYWAYLGLGMIVLAATGIVAAVRGRLQPDRRAVAIAAAGCLVVGLFVYNPVVRDVIFILLFGGLLAAIGFESLIGAAWLTDRRLLAGVAVILLDLASTSVQPVTRTDKGFLVNTGRTLERIAPNQRVAEITIGRDGSFGFDMGPDGSPGSAYATYQRVAGNHNMAATRVHNFILTALALAQHDLQSSHKLSPLSETLFARLNVGRIVCHTATANGCPADFVGAADEPVLGRTLRIAGATPVMFSRNLVSLPPPAGSEKPMLWPWDFDDTPTPAQIIAIEAHLIQLVGLEGYVPAIAPAIAVTSAAVTPTDSAPWHPVLRDYQVRLENVTMRIESDAAGYAALAHPWFPSMVVTVNGQIVQPMRSATGMMVIAIGSGVTDIEFHDGWTPVRRLSAWMSLAGLLMIAVAGFAVARFDRRQTINPDLTAGPASRG